MPRARSCGFRLTNEEASRGSPHSVTTHRHQGFLNRSLKIRPQKVTQSQEDGFLPGMMRQEGSLCAVKAFTWRHRSFVTSSSPTSSPPTPGSDTIPATVVITHSLSPTCLLHCSSWYPGSGIPTEPSPPNPYSNISLPMRHAPTAP